MKRWAALPLAFAFLLAMMQPAAALKISPFKGMIIPGATPQTQLFRLENNSAEEAAVQVSVLTWDIAPDGSEINHDAENDFSVFPAQLILKPHENRGVRVQWLGTGKPPLEKSYRVLAEQVPVQLKDALTNSTAVRFMLRFKAALYIAPETPVNDISVESIQSAPNGQAMATIVNKGTVHTLINKPTLHLMLANGHETVLSGAALKAMDGENIHAGAKRIFPVVMPATEQVTTSHLDFTPGF